MSNEMTSQNQITEGGILRPLLAFFFPILLGTFFQQLYNTADAIIVGKFVGKEALAAVGGVCALRKKGGAALLMIPVTVLGGALYHLIFEAKAQYAYPYMVYMLPLAAAGLCTLAEKLKKISG